MDPTVLCFVLILAYTGWAEGNTDPPTTTETSPPTTTESSPIGNEAADLGELYQKYLRAQEKNEQDFWCPIVDCTIEGVSQLCHDTCTPDDHEYIGCYIENSGDYDRQYEYERSRDGKRTQRIQEYTNCSSNYPFVGFTNGENGSAEWACFLEIPPTSATGCGSHLGWHYGAQGWKTSVYKNDAYINPSVVCKTKNGYGACVFPFNYKNKQYHGCTRADKNGGYTDTPWCAFKVKANGDLDGSNWERCDMTTCAATPINCEWSDWASTLCSKTCDTGQRQKTRSKSIQESNGGTCSGDSMITESCKVIDCPAYTSSGTTEVTIQTRGPGGSSNTFFRQSWSSYVSGFAGNGNSDMWLGLQRLHELTASGDWTLKVELTDWDNTKYWAMYDQFSVGNAASNYRLTVGGFDVTSTLKDSMTLHNGEMFSTHDRDNDWWSSTDCSNEFYGGAGWWFRDCGFSCLNGGDYGQDVGERGIYWRHGGTRGAGNESWKASTVRLIRK